MTRPPPRLAIVVPCYNESEGLRSSVLQLKDALCALYEGGRCCSDSFIVLVDDGSSDDTWDIIVGEHSSAPDKVVGIRLSANSGHQNALSAGLEFAASTSDASISIDADLQDDLSALSIMLDHYMNGSEIVLGVKRQRSVDPALKRLTAFSFYWVMKIMGLKIQPQHADFRLLSSASMRNLKKFHEYHLFLRGLPTFLHSKITTVHYSIKDRSAGTSKYTFRKQLSLALNGITSFSVFPLRLITALGAIIFLVSLILAGRALIEVVNGNSVPGWASITVPLYLLGGVNMLCLGVVGEYVGKAYMEAKRRPRYLVDTIVGAPWSVASHVSSDGSNTQAFRAPAEQL